MQLKNQLLFVLISLSLLVLFELFLSSCASRSAPSGGPKDTLAPKLDTAFPPNQSLNFKQKKIILVFDEYLQLKNPAQQISFSPPLKNKPTITQKGKELSIDWSKDTLLDNTTYIISFGTAIADFTEGNVNEKIKYVFSTGSFIDSLNLGGTVIDITNGEGVEQIMLGLYDLSTLKGSDSIPFNNSPTYYAYTNENGQFSLSNLKYADFHVVAFEDLRGNFKMSSGKEKVAFSADTLHTSLENPKLNLVAFLPASPNRFYGAKHIDKGKIELAFNYRTQGLSVDILSDQSDSSFQYLSLNKAKDTATFWFQETNLDSLSLFVQEADSISDTVVVSLKDFKDALLAVGAGNPEIRFNENILLKVNAPVKAVNFDTIRVFTDKDTLKVSEIRKDPKPFTINLKSKKRSKQFQLYLPKGTVTDIFGRSNDSTLLDFDGLNKDELGNLNFKVTADSSSPLVLQMFFSENLKIIDTSFTSSLNLDLRYLMPGEYDVKLIIDRDGDGKWTTGNYFEKRQAETIIEYTDKAEIRANWDLDLEWRPKLESFQPKKVKESPSDKN